MQSTYVILAKSWCIRWHVDGVPHRKGNPAVIFSDGTLAYWTKGMYKCTGYAPGSFWYSFTRKPCEI